MKITSKSYLLLYIDVCINPIRVGGGLKIKNIEALSKGKVLITSNVGAQGIENGIGKVFFVAETKEEWEKIIKELLLNSKLRENVENNAIEYIQKKYPINKKYNEFLKILKSI
ncbi:MAG: glycosyltransferase [Fusobacteriaceae bacterium]